jgi:hypothetical protein
VHAAASPTTQEHKDSGSLQESDAQSSAGVNAAGAEGKAQRPQKSKASTSSAAVIPSSDLGSDVAPAVAPAISAPASVFAHDAAPVAAAAVDLSVSDGQSSLQSDPSLGNSGL